MLYPFIHLQFIYPSNHKFNVFIKKYCEFKKFTFEEGITLGNRWFKINDDSEETSDLPF